MMTGDQTYPVLTGGRPYPPVKSTIQETPVSNPYSTNDADSARRIASDYRAKARAAEQRGLVTDAKWFNDLAEEWQEAAQPRGRA